MAHPTAQEINYLKTASRQKVKVSTIAKNIGRSEEATRKLIDRYCPGAYKNSWSDYEDGILRRDYPGEKWPALLKSLPGRSRQAIKARAALLNVRRVLQQVSTEKALDLKTKKEDLIKRNCLKCGRSFLADGRYIRLCPRHRKDSALVDHSVAL